MKNEANLLAKKKGFSTSMECEIRDTLVAGADGMFLWVSLILADLKKFASTRNDLNQQRLRKLPRTLPDIYRKILSEVDSEFRKDAQTILHWVVCALPPLTLNELTVAIAVRSRHTSLSAMEDHMERNMKDFLSSLFGPLIKIGDNNSINLYINQ